MCQGHEHVVDGCSINMENEINNNLQHILMRNFFYMCLKEKVRDITVTSSGSSEGIMQSVG